MVSIKDKEINEKMLKLIDDIHYGWELKMI